MASPSKNSMPSSIDSQDYNAKLMASFRNLGLGDHGKTSLNHSFEAGSSSLSVSSEQGSQKDEILHGEKANGTPWKMYMNSCVPGSQPESPIFRENLWAYHYSIDEGSHQPSYLQSTGGNFTPKMNDGSNYQGYDPVTSPRTPLPSYPSDIPLSAYAKTRATSDPYNGPLAAYALNRSYPNYGPLSSYAHTLTSSYPMYESALNQLHGASLRDYEACYYNTAMGDNMLNGYSYYPSNGVSGCGGYNLGNIRGTSGGTVFDCFPEGVDLVTVAKTRTGSHTLHYLLGTGEKEIRKWILVRLYDSIHELLTDPNGHHVFQKLISSCNDNEFQIIVRKLTSENQFLLEAAFDAQGTYSIQKFIKKLKKSPLASTVTSILSTRFFDMMTHPVARHVIKQCLNVLGYPPNMVLFEAAIENCYTLAVHCVGCTSINDCIDFITGPQRDTLLQHLADQSAYLASDPSGNFVLQHVLKTRNPVIADRVCESLRGHYRPVSLKKGGSHVIEICIRYSTLGMNLAAQEFLENPKALAQLAKDQFGNYVVQTILKVTKLENFQLYEALAEALKPHFLFLERYKTGRSVLALIRENLNQFEINELRQEQASV